MNFDVAIELPSVRRPRKTRAIDSLYARCDSGSAGGGDRHSRGSGRSAGSRTRRGDASRCREGGRAKAQMRISVATPEQRCRGAPRGTSPDVGGRRWERPRRCPAVRGCAGRCGAVAGGEGRCQAVRDGAGQCRAVWGSSGRCEMVRGGEGRCGAVAGGAGQ